MTDALDTTWSARRRWTLLATVAAGLLLVTLDNSILYTALPTLTEELGATSSQGLWIINAYPLVMAGLLLGSGTLGDRIGHTRMFYAGLAIFGAASILAAFSASPDVLIAARAILAVGAAAMMPATLALIRTYFSVERERNIAIAVWGSLAVVGAALGPIVGGTLLELFWWGSVFLINVPVVIAAAIATMVLRPTNDADRSKKWDLVSSLQIMVALVGAVFAIKELGHLPPSPIVLIIATVVSVSGFVLFVRRQRRLADPLLDFAVFRNTAFSAGVIAAALALFAVAGVQLVTTQRYQLLGGFSPIEAGLLVAVVALGSLPTSMIGGAFLHRTGLRMLITGGFAVAAAGVGVVILGFQSEFWVLVVGLAVTGAGLGSAMSVASSAILGNVPVSRAGMASAVEEVSYEFGSLTAVAVLGSVLSLVYSASIMLPSGTPDAAREGVSGALEMAGDHPGLAEAAAAAFDRGYLVVMIVIAGAMLVATVVTGVLLRAHGIGTRSQLHSAH